MTRFAVSHRVAVFVFIFGIGVAGLLSYATLPREASPDITMPNIIVTVPYFGVSPNDIETLVTNPLERELSDVKDLDVMTSTSAEGAASLNLQFLPAVEISEALQRVRDKVDKVRPDLPPDIEEPIISEVSFSDFPIIVVSISGDFSLPELKRIADDISDRIESIPGVSSAPVNGGLERELQIDVDPYRLAHYGLSLDDVVQAVSAEHVNVPGGAVATGQVNYSVRVPAEFEGAGSMAEMTVKTVAGQPIRLRQVATVTDGFKEAETASRMRRQPAVSVSVMKRAGGNLIEIVDELKAAIAELAVGFPEGVSVEYLADQSVDIRRMVGELENNILTGLILVLAVLLVFLGFRNALFVAVAIPLTMLISFLVIAMLGITLNMVVLFSLILALGMMVDNAIVVVENIYRHAELGKDRVQAALDGTAEVAWPVITSTITTLCAFGPLMFWPGIMGEFMGFLPLTLIITLSASLFVALVINPVFCSVWLGIKRGPAKEDRSWLSRAYRASLRFSLRWRWITTVGAFGVLILSGLAYDKLGHGVEFFPETTPRKIFVVVDTAEGARLQATDRVVREIEGILDPLANVQNFVADIGTAGGEMDFSSSNTPNMARITVDFLEEEDRVESTLVTIETLRRGIEARVVGADVELKKEDMGPPAGPPINVEIAGDDYELLARHARTVRRLLRTVSGVTDIRDDYSSGRPEVQIRPDRATARQLGLESTRAIANAVRTAVYGQVAAKLRERDDEHDIRVRLAERYRDSLPLLRNLDVYGEGDVRVPLRLVAGIETGAGTGSIKHKDQKRVITVGANVEGRNAVEALQEVQALLAKQTFEGATISYTGENEEQEKAAIFLTKALLSALALIALVLVTQFNSLIQPAIILISVILSFIGVLWGLIITATPFGIMMTGIGVISLAGVVVNNAIVLIDYTNLLRRGDDLGHAPATDAAAGAAGADGAEGEAPAEPAEPAEPAQPAERGMPLFEAVVEAGETRLRPVLLTAITTVLGLIPMATGVGFDFIELKVQVGGQSAEWWGPMAVAVIFGLSFSTVLTLVVVPTFYYLFERIKLWWAAIFARHPWTRTLVYTTAGIGMLGFTVELVTALLHAVKGA